jgi:hypothetical protein
VSRKIFLSIIAVISGLFAESNVFGGVFTIINTTDKPVTIYKISSIKRELLPPSKSRPDEIFVNDKLWNKYNSWNNRYIISEPFMASRYTQQTEMLAPGAHKTSSYVVDDSKGNLPLTITGELWFSGHPMREIAFDGLILYSLRYGYKICIDTKNERTKCP